eukprot:CAMPEP_0167756522 /NCGR_PEP_ID=MMETSP0110_2-20121227/9431_1 /TAXON_ID=629695 /ORGANISM="Gymnochlora sp., Strain CCMP2014" /LENGTH=328 /DNA_ID=CAMNT_0007642639 /DNA_START=81 /DNA_END=1063 /DNA_ORIENTATION=+
MFEDSTDDVKNTRAPDSPQQRNLSEYSSSSESESSSDNDSFTSSNSMDSHSSASLDFSNGSQEDDNLNYHVKIQVLQQKSLEDAMLVPLKPGEDRSIIYPIRDYNDLSPKLAEKEPVSAKETRLEILEPYSPEQSSSSYKEEEKIVSPTLLRSSLRERKRNSKIPDTRKRKRSGERKLRKKRKVEVISGNTFEVESILAEKGGFYLIKWKGRDIVDATWEPRSHLKFCPGKLKRFERQVKASKKEIFIPSAAPPPPTLGQIEKIVTRKRNLYLVKWMSSDMENSSWHARDDLIQVGLKSMIQKFERGCIQEDGKKKKYPRVPTAAPEL